MALRLWARAPVREEDANVCTVYLTITINVSLWQHWVDRPPEREQGTKIRTVNVVRGEGVVTEDVERARSAIVSCASIQVAWVLGKWSTGIFERVASAPARRTTLLP